MPVFLVQSVWSSCLVHACFPFRCLPHRVNPTRAVHAAHDERAARWRWRLQTESERPCETLTLLAGYTPERRRQNARARRFTLYCVWVGGWAAHRATALELERAGGRRRNGPRARYCYWLVTTGIFLWAVGLLLYILLYVWW